MRVEPHDRATLTQLKSRAAFYALYLVNIEHYAPDEAAALVAERYPPVRPWLEKIIRGEKEREEQTA